MEGKRPGATPALRLPGHREGPSGALPGSAMSIYNWRRTSTDARVPLPPSAALWGQKGGPPRAPWQRLSFKPHGGTSVGPTLSRLRGSLGPTPPARGRGILAAGSGNSPAAVVF